MAANGEDDSVESVINAANKIIQENMIRKKRKRAQEHKNRHEALITTVEILTAEQANSSLTTRPSQIPLISLSSRSAQIPVISISSRSAQLPVTSSPSNGQRNQNRNRSLNQDDDIIWVDNTLPEPMKSDSVIIVDDSPTAPKTRRLSTSDHQPSSRDLSEFLKCPICLESTVNKKPTSTICGHIYCHQCISDCIKMTKRCAVCKKNLSLRNIHSIFL